MTQDLAPLNITVRVGCNVIYETSVPTLIIFVVKPCLDRGQFVMQEKLSFDPGNPSSDYVDLQGNINYRAMLQPGRNTIYHDAMVAVSSLPESYNVRGEVLPVNQLPFQRAPLHPAEPVLRFR